MSHPRFSSVAAAALLALPLLASGCGAEFDPASEVTGLRVLAVKKSLPYARPGEQVELSMLWHDAEPDRPPPQIGWLAVCENPPADLFEACFAQLPALSEEELAARISIPDPSSTTVNDRFSFTVSSDIISSRPPPGDPNSTPYGLTYVFFAVCSGQLAVSMDTEIPFLCYEELDGVPGFSAGDTRRDSRDLVIGYSAVFSYEEFENNNPLFTGIEFGNATYWPDAPADVAAAAPAGAVLAPARDVCLGDGCLQAPAVDEDLPCLEGLTVGICPDGDDDCDTTPIQARIDPASAELDAAASERGSDTLTEQMWVNYYSTQGEMDEEVRLLNDAVEGFQEDVSTGYQAANAAGVAYLWAVAHDNRGGTDWARLRVCAR